MEKASYIRLYERAPEISETTSLRYWVELYFSTFDCAESKKISELISSEKSVVREFATFLNTTSQSKAIQIINNYIPNKPKSIKHKTYILSLYNRKQCTVCKLVLTIDSFNANAAKQDNKAGSCKFCNSSYIKNDSARYRDLSAQKRFLANTIISKKYKLEIAEIYKNCPKGFHVDHIVPINNDIVCGLHVPWNLQYLTIADNLVKSNKFE